MLGPSIIISLRPVCFGPFFLVFNFLKELGGIIGHKIEQHKVQKLSEGVPVHARDKDLRQRSH